ncbi:MAG: GlsB/YeaQ/YmgE family stress response membrane protein [Chloroflexi bacterium]|nr:GlsB/YeaQ/YmgE family stress response membrane protein [Chloroflexota bacterium]
MGLIAWLVVGGIAGWLASKVISSGLGLIGNILVGIVGGFIGGFLFHAIGEPGMTGFSLWSVFVAFIGAVVLLYAIRLVSGRRSLRA